MDELVTWLREQLDADEAAAEAMILNAPPGYGKLPAGFYDPARVLADVAAKRAIVDEYVRLAEYDLTAAPAFQGACAALADVIRLLATAYADRPGYRDEWRPARSET